MQRLRPLLGTVQRLRPLLGTVQRLRPLLCTMQRLRPLLGTVQRLRPLLGTVQRLRPLLGTMQRNILTKINIFKSHAKSVLVYLQPYQTVRVILSNNSYLQDIQKTNRPHIHSSQSLQTNTGF